MSNHTASKSTVRFTDTGMKVTRFEQVAAVLIVLGLGFAMIWLAVFATATALETNAGHHAVGATLAWILGILWWGLIIKTIAEGVMEALRK